MVTTVNLAINQSGSAIQTALNSQEAAIAALDARLTNVEAKNTAQDSQIAILQIQVANLIDRVNTLSEQQVWPGTYVGAVVHLKNKDGDCTAAIIYEDPTRRANTETISVVYVDPDFPGEGWYFRRDVREDTGAPDLPFNTWHVPEFYYEATGPVQLRRRVA